MKRALFMIKHNCNIMIFKKPLFFIASIVIPIIAVMGMGAIFSSNSGSISYGYVDNDNSNSSKMIIEKIKGEKGINLKEYSEEEIKSDIKIGNMSGGLVFNKGFENEILNGKLDVEVLELDSEKDGLLENLIKQEGNNLISIAKITDGNKDKYLNNIEKYNEERQQINTKSLDRSRDEDFTSVAFVGFVIMAIFVKGTLGADRINNDKEERVYERMFVSGIKSYQYYIGNIGASLISIFIQIIIIVGVVSKVPQLDIGIEPLKLFIILGLTGILAVSIGSFIVSVTRNSEESSMVSNFVMMTLMMLGGCFVPVMLFPTFIEKISWFLPTRWIMDMVNGFQSGGSISEYGINIGVVLLFSLAFLLFVAYKTNIEEKANQR